ncbi:hypothetical protein OIDMADRAFT_19799 [Oidiodendron maius Zn]|uniref:Uncharacterized protein n=1 Tax=Oidiodendron maius (strain Zn) TaxID=913774 RepID=A0A0C3DD40_OIDMZ|nr:hypothetical protein OIDMADRAFT_19799 [Oidiodendron maius Zn]
MKFFAYTSMFLLGIFLPDAIGAAATPVGANLTTDSTTCESGLNHNYGTSCHGSIGAFACSGDDRDYILQCESNSLWGVYTYCPSGTGCHNCGCAPGY